MAMMYNTLDALGYEIKMGEKYGYSNSISGITNVRIGKAIKFTETGLLTMSIEQAKSALYNDVLEPVEMMHKSIKVKPSLLFPIDRVV